MNPNSLLVIIRENPMQSIDDLADKLNIRPGPRLDHLRIIIADLLQQGKIQSFMSYTHGNAEQPLYYVPLLLTR